MSTKTYIQVIVPLKLDWEPFYSVPEGLELIVGDRVSVIFSGKEYMAVVSATGVVPPATLLRKEILEVLDKVTDLPLITEEEIKFWRAVASYYLCTVGEVYKNVYFQDRKPPKKWCGKDRNSIASIPVLSLEQNNSLAAIMGALTARKTVLLQGEDRDRTELYLSLAVNTIKDGKSVLYIVPEIAFSKQLEERVKAVFPDVMVYNSKLTPAARRDTVIEARSGKPIIVLGTRSALFIPFKDLGLIIVDQEHDVLYKQESPSPRYNARDLAIMLGAVYGASVILGSSIPSLEAYYNAQTSLFAGIELDSADNHAPVMVIDTTAERRKRGMVGELSLKLLAEIKRVKEAGGKILVVSWTEESDLQGFDYATPFTVKSLPADGYDLIAILQADSLLNKQDFRCDERALQLLRRLNASCPLVIQTKVSEHPVFKALTTSQQGLYDTMLAERRTFGYPPFTRLVKLELTDADENRQKLRARFLGNRVKEVLRPFSDPLILGPEQGEIRIFFKRDRNLAAGKQALYREITSFEQQYSCHVTIDVDPL